MSSVKKNFFYNTIYQILAIILPLITSPYLSRVFGVEGIGIYSFTFSIATYFGLFTMLGIKNYGVRTIAQSMSNKKELSKNFWNIYYLQFISSSIVIVAYSAYILFISKEYNNIKWIQGLIVVSGMFDISWFFFGIEKFKITVIRNIIVRILTVILMFLFVRTFNDLWINALIMAGSTLINQILLWSFLKEYVSFEKPKTKEIKKHLKPALTLFIPILAVSLYIYMDKIMLGYLSNMTQVGLYNSAEKMINIPMGFIVAFGTVMLPRMSYLVEKKDQASIKKNLRGSMEFNIFLGSAMMFGLAGIAESFVPIFFGKGFEGVISLVTLISPIILIKSWANVIRNQILLPNAKDKEYTFSVVMGAVVNLIINLVLISRYGAAGAVVGTIVAEFMVALVQTIVAKKYMEIDYYIKNGYKYVLIGLTMYVLINYLGRIIDRKIFALLLQMGVGGAFYLLASFALYENKQAVMKPIKKILRIR